MRRALAVWGSLLVASAACASACSGATGGASPTSSGAGGGSAGTLGIETDAGSNGIGGGCASENHTGQLVPLDMFLMLDKSASMAKNDKWTAVTGAISQFVGLSGVSGISMGLGIFPVSPSAPAPERCQTQNDCELYGPCLNGYCLTSCPLPPICLPPDSCVYTDYSTPRVPIAPLPGVGSAIDSALAAETADGNSTPMDAALHGAITYAEQWSEQHSDHITIVVLATDGDPQGCDPDTVDTVSSRAAQGYSSRPPVRTFVIGVGSALTSLDSIAQKGGTGQALIVDTSSDPGQQFLDALNTIRGSLGCTYHIPTPESGTPDYARVNVAFTPNDGKQEVFPRTLDASTCQGGQAWYYDNLKNPTRIILCPASCDLVTHQAGNVQVVLGCKTVLK